MSDRSETTPPPPTAGLSRPRYSVTRQAPCPPGGGRMTMVERAYFDHCRSCRQCRAIASLPAPPRGVRCSVEGALWASWERLAQGGTP